MRNLLYSSISTVQFLSMGGGQGKKEQSHQSRQTTEMRHDSLIVKLEKVWETEGSKLVTPGCVTYYPESDFFCI